jgi:hypothetical protein
MASKALGAGRLSAVTWKSDRDDDWLYASFLAKEFDLDLRVVARDEGDLVSWDELYRSAEPGNELAGTLRSVLNGLIDGRHDAIVTGVGGDDVFHSRSLQPDWLADLLRAGRFSEAFRIVCALPTDGSPRRLPISQLWRYGVRPICARPTSSDYSPRYRYTTEFLRLCSGLAPVDLNLPDEISAGRLRYWRNLRALVASRVAVSHLMPEIRFRHPLLSLPLVEFAVSILGRFEEQLRADRTLQRSAFANFVPQRILQRTSKGGSLAPEAVYWRGTEARRMFSASKSRVVALDIVGAEQWEELLTRAAFGRFASLREFDMLLKTELWLRGQEHAGATSSTPLLRIYP